MKRRDVFIQILHEVSGRPKDSIEGVLDAFLMKSGAPHMFNEEIAEAEYESLLENMRKEKDGINDWLMRGNLALILRHSDPKGSA